MQFFRFCKPSVPSTPKNDFLPISSEKSFYFITDISGQVCPLILQNYFPSHLKRTNFHRMTICRFVNFLWMKICPSYYNVHFFFKKQVYDQKIFSFHTKRTFFGQMDTPHNCKISINIVTYPSLTIQRTFFSQKSGYYLKKFAENSKFLCLAQIARNLWQLCCAIFSDFFHFRNTWNVEKATDVNKIWI